ncbi:sugar-binding protein [Streptomyces silvensis]|uniref:Sugar-binding protein n=2 Tax=Streptomyces silvensis TaxID=1765722 RepID=A0A0W7WVR8_9ACTN|nr:sugar-binding protein [Streptomyces silvensis]
MAQSAVGGKGAVTADVGRARDQESPKSGDGDPEPRRERLPKGVKAPQAKRVKELKGERTPSTRFWELSDGRVQAELSAFPTTYKAGNAWKPIDTDVRRASQRRGGGVYEFANTTNTGRSYFGSDARRLLRYEAGGGQAVTVGLDRKGRLKPQVKGDRVTYRDPVSGARLRYQVGVGQVKEEIVLAERPKGPVSFDFRLDADGLRPEPRKDGSIAFFGEYSRHPALVIPAAHMTDARDVVSSPYGKAGSVKVRQKLSKDGDAWRVTVTPDADWLAAKQRRYPVVIDPTITISPRPAQSQDVMVLSDQPGVNFNANWRLAVGRTDTGVARSLLKFPLDEIPAGVDIDSARLGVYYDQTHTTNGNDVTIEAHRATGAWDEATATWDKTDNLAGELSGTTVRTDDGDPGTAAVGDWPKVTTTGGDATNNDYLYNKNTARNESYTWQPKVPESSTYRVEAHFPKASDAAKDAPYTVTHDGGTKTGTVDQNGADSDWKPVVGGQIGFAKGTAGKVVLGDTGDGGKRNIADSVRLVNPAQVVKNKGEYNQWHNFPVKDTVQKWVDGTANHGFVLRAKDESADAPKGGPRYEQADYDYGGETSTYPRLTVTYGKVGSALDSPTVVHGNGPELSWSKYSNDSDDPDLDIAEYQIHRSTREGFAPDASTLIAPVSKARTTFRDTTATPTPDSSTNEIGRVYFYQVAVKAKDGQLLGSPVRMVGIPKAGRTMKLIQAGQSDTTLSSAKPDTNFDALPSWDVGQTWTSVGNNSDTYGKTRAVLKFPTGSVPSTATILESQLQMWGSETTSESRGAVYELHALTRDFDEKRATWNKADATTAWTKAGGDYSGTVSDTVPEITSDVGRHWWDATALTQKWVTKPSSNTGALIKLKDESATGGQERTLFLSAEAKDKQLRPLLRVIYVDSSTESTYYAPKTPSRMTEGLTYTTDVTVTNTTDSAWPASERELSYRWTLPDGTDATTAANQLETALPALAPGKSATVKAKVKSPTVDDGNGRVGHVLMWDVRNKTDSSWLSQKPGIPGLAQSVAVEDAGTADQLGLEKFYGYTGKNTGAGSTLMSNLASGNAVWSYDAFNNPGRGLNTFLRLSYNAQDTSDSSLGYGWTAQASGPLRLGAPLDFEPDTNPTKAHLTDGDGTTHVFRKETDGGWTSPPGLHYRLKPKPNLTCTPDNDAVTDAWTLTRPDGTRFLLDCDGRLTSIVDTNGNAQRYVYEERDSEGRPVKFLKEIRDPADRRSLTVDFYEQGDATYDYIDANGKPAKGTDLKNPRIYDHVKSFTDVSGRKVTFLYTAKGLLGRVVDGDGATQPKAFAFTYDAAQGNRNAKLTKVTDPRDSGTGLDYGARWVTKTVTDRLGGTTGFAYAARPTGGGRQTKVTDAEKHTTTHETDDLARPVRTVNAKSEQTKLTWDADHNVTLLEENNGAKTAYCFDAKTGYPTWQRAAEENKEGVPSADECAPGKYPQHSVRYEYQTREDGYVADLKKKISAENRGWEFGYDAKGNLKKVTDPKGVATPAAGDYTTSYDYDGYGRLTKATDANGNATLYADYVASGYPRTTTDALNKATKTEYDARGQVTAVTDALGKKTTQTYDTYGRPLVSKVPKDQAAGVYITTPAPEYDANDNVTKSTAPNDAVSTAVYDKTDQVIEATAPKDTATSPERTSTYAYDKVGNLLTTTEPKGTATPSDPDDYVTTNAYDEIYQLTSVVNAEKDKVSYVYDGVGNPVEVVDPKKNGTSDPDDYTTRTAFDLNHRVVAVTDAAGRTVKQAYDKDALLLTTTDAENNVTKNHYDERGKLAVVEIPHKDDTLRTTKFGYDEVGNRVKVITPRAVAAGTSEAFVAETTYDPLNRPARQIQPYDPNDPRYNRKVWTETTYDAVGRVAKVSAPPSEGEQTRNDTTYGYYDNGWVKSSKDAWNITTTYDYNSLGQQSARQLTSAAGSSSRTMRWGHYPDGKLKSLDDDGIPVGRNEVLGEAAQKRGGAGWKLPIPRSGTYTAYADRTGDGKGWLKLSTKSYRKNEITTLTPAGAAKVKLVRDASAEADTENKRFAYAYDVNGNLTSIDDKSTGTKVDAYTISYTGLNQVAKVVEALAGQEKKSTSYTYDANGQPQTLTHPDQYATYTYDLRELVKEVSVGKSASDSSPKVTTYDYTSRGERKQEHKANKNTVDYAYYLDGALKSATEKKANGSLVSSHTYAYDANGNKAQDEARKMNADDTSKYVSSTTDYTYDPADRLAKSVRTGDGAGTETYVHDDNANVISQTVKGKTTTYGYDRNRLLKATEGGSEVWYQYDPFGRQESTTAGGKVVERTTYDGFDRVKQHERTEAGTGALKATTYAYDPLDRTASRTDAAGKKTDYNYLGMSGEVLSEDVAGKLTKSYQYSPWGERLSQVKHAADGATEDGFYGYNSHTDVETLTDKDGNAKATYGYTAYGNADPSDFTGIDKPTATDPTKEAYNPYRFNSKRWDAASGTYDMGFRDYSPGLNRFTTRDMYTGALADMDLGSDPMTGNRYAFAGGNPVGNVELDGHIFGCGVCDAVIDKVEDTGKAVSKGAAKAARKAVKGAKVSPLGVAARVFGNVIGWNSSAGPRESKYDKDNPNYNLGLWITPKKEREYRQHDSTPVNMSDCKSKGSAGVYYFPVDDLGRAQGVNACLSPGSFNFTNDKGRDAFPGVKSKIWGTGTELPTPFGTDRMVPGYYSRRDAKRLGKPVVERGHLLAKRLGGSGVDRRNLVTLYQKVNNPRMSTFEGEMADRIKGGETLYYNVRANYSGSDPIPDSLSITWQSMTTGAGGSFPLANVP